MLLVAATRALQGLDNERWAVKPDFLPGQHFVNSTCTKEDPHFTETAIGYMDQKQAVE